MSCEKLFWPWAPPSARGLIEEEREVEDGSLASGDEEYTCDLTDQHGKVCDLKFASFAALRTHQRFSRAPGHGLAVMASQAVVTNQCPLCYSTFADIPTTQVHVRGALRNGRCLVDRAHVPHEVVVPMALNSPLCVQ